jgi:hypothetical protein
MRGVSARTEETMKTEPLMFPSGLLMFPPSDAETSGYAPERTIVIQTQSGDPNALTTAAERQEQHAARQPATSPAKPEAPADARAVSVSDVLRGKRLDVDEGVDRER